MEAISDCHKNLYVSVIGIQRCKFAASKEDAAVNELVQEELLI